MDYVLVFYKSNGCPHCATMSEIWEDLSNIYKKTITSEVKKEFPGMRTEVVVAKDNSGDVDTTKYPKNITKFSNWFPMIILVPKKVWENAERAIKTGENAEIKEGVFVLNGNYDGEKLLSYEGLYETRTPEGILKWIRDSIKKVSDDSKGQQIKIPLIIKKSVENNSKEEDENQKKGIPSIANSSNKTNFNHNPIIKPMTEENLRKINNSNNTERNEIVTPIVNQICRMKIIEKTKKY